MGDPLSIIFNTYSPKTIQPKGRKKNLQILCSEKAILFLSVLPGFIIEA